MKKRFLSGLLSGCCEISFIAVWFHNIPKKTARRQYQYTTFQEKGKAFL
jgi:hypothetical protein